jgi:hypothetical protein
MKQEFSAVIKQHEGINGAFVEIPFDVQEVFGAKRVKVIATFDGYEYKGSIISMSGCYMIGITQQIRKEINKGFEDSVLVTVEKDEEERQIILPSDFQEAIMQNENAKDFWNTLSYSKQKKFADMILSAKKADTRALRIEKAVAMLRDHTIIK